MNNSLFNVAMTGRLNNVRRFIQGGANVNARDNYGRTALLRVVEEGENNVVRELIQAGANVNTRDMYGRTALTEAALLGRTQIVHELIRGGANVNARDNIGWTALMHAARWGHTQVVRELLTAGAKNLKSAYNVARNQTVRNAISNAAVRKIQTVVRKNYKRKVDAAKKIQTAVYKYLYHPNRVQRPKTIVSAGKSRYNNAVRTAKIQSIVRKYLYNKNRVTKKYSTPR